MEFIKQCLYKIKDFFLASGWDILKFVMVLIVGLILIKVAIRLLNTFLDKAKSEKVLRSFLLSIAKFFMWLVLILILLSMLKVPITSFIAILSAMGLAISLALQNSLSNLASGLMIIINKPFKQGDFIEIGSTSGVIKEIKLFNTILTTPDNKVITIPNNKVFNSDIVNFNARDTRRIDITIGVDYCSDNEFVKQVLTSVVINHPNVVQNDDKPILVRLASFGEYSLNYVVRCHTKTENYWTVFYDLNEQILQALRDNNIDIPYPHINVLTKTSTDNNMNNNATTNLELKSSNKKNTLN